MGIIALSAIADDPRVRRQGDAFAAAGWDVVAIGLPGAKSAAPLWTVLEDLPPPGLTAAAETPAAVASAGARAQRVRLRERLLRVPIVGADLQRSARLGYSALRYIASRAQLARLRHAVRLASVRVRPKRAEMLFWTLNDSFQLFHAIGTRERPDIWLANDWTALPIARRLARGQGVPFIYDTHELASDEYEERLRWRLLFRPVVRALERLCLQDASLVTCVSDGIADRLQELYALQERPTVVRNTPSYSHIAFRPTPERIAVLYHGIVAPGRGLEECVRSVAKWRPEFRLTIRGPSSADYRAHLLAEIKAAGVEARVELAPAVAMVDLVREAASFDVGIFALPNHSLHNKYALPNKFFEYIMAGLALCVSDLPEMGRLARAHNVGVLIPDTQPNVIAATINSLDRTTIDHHKQCSLDAARELNWERESAKLVERCLGILRSRRTCAG